MTQISAMAENNSNNLYKTFVAALPDAALVVDYNQVIVAANSATAEVLSSDLEGQHAALFLRAPDILMALSETLSSRVHRKVELLVRGKVQRTLDVHLSPLGANEERSLALVILRDRTREEQVERMRSDFVANASHELRTPLTTISGFIETMQGAAAKDEKARSEFLKVMKAQADRMSHLIDDLLSLSRIELDEHVAPSATVNLTDITQQAWNLLQSLAKDLDCKINVNLPEQMLVRGDANQLAQVVHNLLENAIKYAGAGKPIDVSGKQEGEVVSLNIRDHGPGIAAHHIPRLTERFYRVSVQDSRTRGGTGLGLAICKHIINRHRGTLNIESELGVGSVFAIRLPAL
jgi:two-component system, OmpR family, phosphate regulon sensor histidine kinase PhoR